MLTDVAVVGGGPIGLTTARIAAELGSRVIVFERKQEGAAPSCCTGLVSPRTLPTLGVSGDSVLREIRAVCVHLPSGRRIDLRSSEVKAVVIDRKKLETELLLLAREIGVDVRFETEAISAEEGELMVQSGSVIQSITAPVIVGADGPRSRVADWFSLGQPTNLIAASQVELEEASSHSDQVDVFVGENIAPGFLGWSVPAEDGITRVGLGVLPPHTPLVFVDRLLAELSPNLRIRARSAGWIPLSPTPRSATTGAMLVGDAAGHVKPLTGGGLYTGGLCARIAGETAARIVESGARISGSECGASDLLAAYPRRCLEAIGKEQAFGRSIRHYLSCLRDEDVETAAASLDDPQFLQFLADHADIDRFHQLPDRLASEPRLWKTILRIIPLLGTSIG
ncbi:MAG: NAD(P)/FAD-dependent oxidoreductase [Candidatus Bipolaricaulota bacterium]